MINIFPWAIRKGLTSVDVKDKSFAYSTLGSDGCTWFEENACTGNCDTTGQNTS